MKLARLFFVKGNRVLDQTSRIFSSGPEREETMNFRTAEKEGVVIVTPKGRILDGTDTNRLREKIEEFVRIGARRMVIDLGEVPHMDSSGIRILVAALNNLNHAGGELHLARITDRVEDLIAITQLTEKFKTYPSVEAAVSNFSSVN